MSRVLSVNVADATFAADYATVPTGIAKHPVEHAVEVRDPGPKISGLGAGLVGDHVGDRRHHGGSGQAVYAFARERLDSWAAELDRPLRDGAFGENLTTVGVDVDDALVGERWRVGPTVVLQVTSPRIPCRTFRGWLDVPGWVRRFTADARPGAYLAVVVPGAIRAGDAIEVVHRPDHDVTVALTFSAVVRDATLLPRLRPAWDDLDDELRGIVESGRTYRLES